MKIALMAATSHPVVTIATRDDVEAKVLARRRADANREELEQHIANPAVSVGVKLPGSPEGLDG